MMEKPILFSTPMVQAILAGRKTRTRRVMKATINGGDAPFRELVTARLGLNKNGPCAEFLDADGFYAGAAKQFYEVGDILWVRETWLNWDGFAWDLQQHFEGVGKKAPYLYRADIDPEKQTKGWRPSIHMPKKAARIFLRVTDVRVERVQDITLEDMEREGIYCDGMGYTKEHPAYPGGMRIHWIKLWDSLNAKRGFGWDQNPWVWVYTFERVEKPEGWCG